MDGAQEDERESDQPGEPGGRADQKEKRRVIIVKKKIKRHAKPCHGSARLSAMERDQWERADTGVLLNIACPLMILSGKKMGGYKSVRIKRLIQETRRIAYTFPDVETANERCRAVWPAWKGLDYSGHTYKGQWYEKMAMYEITQTGKHFAALFIALHQLYKWGAKRMNILADASDNLHDELRKESGTMDGFAARVMRDFEGIFGFSLKDAFAEELEAEDVMSAELVID